MFKSKTGKLSLAMDKFLKYVDEISSSCKVIGRWISAQNGDIYISTKHLKAKPETLNQWCNS